MIDYGLSKRYFTSDKSSILSCAIAIILVIISLICLIIFLNLAPDSPLFALLMTAVVTIGIGYAIIRSNSVNDNRYDSNVQKEVGLQKFKSKALQELDLDRQEVEAVKPITISGYTFVGANQSKLGEDGLWRTDRYASSILFFSAEAIHVYQYSFSTTSPNNSLTTTHEYFYKDVVSIDISQESTVISNNNVTVNNLNIVLSSGTSFKTAFDQKDSEQINNSLRAMRNLLKEKKK